MCNDMIIDIGSIYISEKPKLLKDSFFRFVFVFVFFSRKSLIKRNERNNCVMIINLIADTRNNNIRKSLWDERDVSQPFRNKNN